VAEFFDFLRGEVSIAAGGEVEFEEADFHATEFFHQLAEVFEHHSDLVLAAFGEADFIPRILAGLDEFDVGGRGAAAMQRDAGLKRFHLFIGEGPGNFHYIRFDDVGGGRCDAMGELAIIGEQQQAFAGIVEAADGEDALLHAAQQVHDGLAAFRIGHGGDALAWFVERDVDVGAGGAQQSAVDFDVVGFDVGFGAEFGDDLAVDHDAALQDHVFGFAAAGDTGLG
jgi:hypothetical protein